MKEVFANLLISPSVPIYIASNYVNINFFWFYAYRFDFYVVK